jgi:alpha-ribazole phosphatase/probable phosphoglycerate mutase
MTTRVLLVRHAEPADDARGRCYGALDVPLSPLGRRAAAALAAGLASVPLAAVYTSPRARALDTARLAAELRGLEPVALAALRELDFGELEGQSYEDIARARPALYRAWMERPTAVRFPGGEGYPDLRERVVAALGEIRARHAGATVAVVAHGGVVRAALADALAMPDEAIFRLAVDYCSVSVVDWLDGTPVVRLVNGRAADAIASVAM